MHGSNYKRIFSRSLFSVHNGVLSFVSSEFVIQYYYFFFGSCALLFDDDERRTGFLWYNSTHNMLNVYCTATATAYSLPLHLPLNEIICTLAQTRIMAIRNISCSWTWSWSWWNFQNNTIRSTFSIQGILIVIFFFMQNVLLAKAKLTEAKRSRLV